MYWSARTYSKYSIKAALPTVTDYVSAASAMGQPALAITDHGNMASVLDLYRKAKAANINPIPGIEMPISANGHLKRPLTGKLSLLATSTTGYKNLAHLTRVAYAVNETGVLDLADLADAAEYGRLDGIACLSGTYSAGLIHRVMQNSRDIHTIKNLVHALNGWFGNGLWIDLSLDGNYTPEQLNQVHTLSMTIANSMGLPVVATNGPRYLEEKDAQAWSTLNAINQGTPLYVPNLLAGHLLKYEEAQQYYQPEAWNAAMQGLTSLASIANVSIPELDTFTVAVPDVSAPKDPDQDLFDRVCSELHHRISKGQIAEADQKTYWDRLNEEVDTVVTAGFSGYLLFTATVTDWISDHRILYNTRGSASASLLCWLLNITTIDPLQWGLRFDRFLSTDRSKPPDVDIDVDPGRREEVTDWLAHTFPTMRICTWSTGKVSEDTSEITGSLVVQYNTMISRTGKSKAPLSDKEQHQLKALAEYEPYLSVGVGAAGVLVAPDEATMNSIPVFRVDSSGTVVTALDKKQVEALGYVKLDVLGVKTLAALSALEESTGVSWGDIPRDDKDVYKSMWGGRTGGMFQLDGATFQKGMKQLKPKELKDLVDAMAIFRPATMKAGGTKAYLARRFRKEDIPQRHAIIQKHVQETYGVLIYQEQVISVLRDLDLTSEEIEEARQAIKASNSAVAAAKTRMKAIMQKAMQNGRALGMSTEDLAWLDTALEAYAEYGFNKAHAVSYANIAYITAYYKLYYPLQFWAAFLTVYTGDDNEKSYLKEIRESGITLRGPHVNKSKAGYTVDPDGKSIRKSLTSIKGVGLSAASALEAQAPYRHLNDLVERLPASKVTGLKQLAKGHTPASCGGAIAALAEAGALAELTWKDTP